MNQKIPIYRAKSNEIKNSYVEGLLIGLDEDLNLCTIRTKDDYIGGEICYLHTLSIHFPDMLDSQGNKIFASLNEDGKGGDILYYKSKIDLVTKTTVYFENYRLITHSKGENTFRDKESLSKFEIIGIKDD